MKYKISNPSLLLKYAYPCIEFWYKNRKLALKIKENQAKEFYKAANPTLLKKLKSVAEGREKFSKSLQKKLEKLIPFAICFLSKLGKRSGNETIIDEKTIRKYFCEFHRTLIKKQKKEFVQYKDVLELCEVKVARIIEIRRKRARVKIFRDGEREVRLDFIDNPKLGDRIKIHFFYACEKI